MNQLVASATPADAAESTDDHFHVVLPKLLSMARYALPNILEGTVWPFVIFYVFLITTNVWGALLAALVGAPRSALAESPFQAGRQSIAIAGGYALGLPIGVAEGTDLEDVRMGAFLPSWSMMRSMRIV